MRRLAQITVVGMVALTIAGCGADTEETTASNPSTSQEVVNTQQPAPKPFENPPTVAQTTTTQSSSAPALIQSTNANQRTRQVKTGRQDPFAGLSPGAIKLPTKPTEKTPPPLPKLPVAKAPPPPSPLPSRLPEVVPSPPPELPPPAQPDIARSITITGVAQIGNETQAIVLVPNEGTSRYVRQGQMLSNGRVRVKRIEVNQGAQPLVILEENGIEVAKAVGQAPANSEQANAPASNASESNAPASAVPPPPPSSTSTPTTPFPSAPPLPDNITPPSTRPTGTAPGPASTPPSADDEEDEDEDEE